ncbi:MAG: DUF3791 domain-containing protein [Oscillospiraceae bacterium]|nr:DUF3791 domain-containing protein [Oscillospiraceae bacterium]
MTFSKPKGEIWFLASCVEFYKDEKGMSGQDAYDYLCKNNAVDFIVTHWEGLHTTSPMYVIDSIDEFIKNNAANSA